MSICEFHSLCGKLVDVRSGDFSTLGIVAGNITIAEVVGVYDENIRLIFREC